jgi:Ca2+-binding EF-hand superfamily protein
MFANSLSEKISAADLNNRGRQVGFGCLNDATLILKRFDSDEDGYLSYWEFANIILP